MTRLIVGLVLMITSSCAGPVHPSLELRELQADPAAHIAMPGADELAHFQQERGATVEGPQFAYDRSLFGTQRSFDDVALFYEGELRRLGWTRDDAIVSLGTTDVDGRGWCKRRMSFRLAQNRIGAHAGPLAQKERDYRTIFDAGLIARRSEAACGV